MDTFARLPAPAVQVVDPFGRLAASPVPNLAPHEDHSYDPAEGVVIARTTDLVRLTSDPTAQSGGVPYAPARPARIVSTVSIRPFLQWVAHRFHEGHVEIARRPAGEMSAAGEMQPAYQPAVTTLSAQCPWDTTRIGGGI